MRLRATALLLLTVLGLACNATPIPQPPPNLDVGKIGFPETTATTNGVDFFGEPGAAPFGSLIRVTNLDSLDAPWIIQVADDGSFEASISADLNDELRFQVRVGDERKAPVDLVYTGFAFAAPSRIDCFVIDAELDFGTVAVGIPDPATLGLNNGCTADAAIGPTALRTVGSAFDLGTPPTSVSAGVAQGYGLTFTPASVGEAEEMLLLTVQVGGETVRYPVTLFGSGE